jgi:hypothetical protein
MATKQERIDEALAILADLDMPRGQRNVRSALTLLALLDLRADRRWAKASSPLIGITPIMDWMRDHYDKIYKPNTRETVRRQTVHQFMQAGIVIKNPEHAGIPVNSPKAAYQIEPTCLALLRTYGTAEYALRLKGFKAAQPGLAAKYAKARDMEMIPVKLASGKEIKLSAGAHSELIKKVVEEFVPRFVPGGQLVYIGDTGDKMGYYDKDLLESMGVTVDDHGKMPDAIIYYDDKGWLVLAEAVTSHGPVDAKRHEELEYLFRDAEPGLVFVSTFPDRRTFAKYMEAISWETEVWLADNPSHLIHFNGARFLGPYESE